MATEKEGPTRSRPPPPAGAGPVEWVPRFNPWLIAISVMLATFMEVLDTAVANVSLPHIAGSLSATPEEATWVLTSYLVSNAIVLPMTAWLGSRFGRKRFLIACIVVFTVASALCGAATSLGMLVAGADPPGRRRRSAPAHRPGRAHGELSARPARHGDGRLRDGRDRRAHPRPDARRLDHGQLLVAVGLLHQPARGRARDPDGARLHRGPAVHPRGAPAAASTTWASA